MRSFDLADEVNLELEYMICWKFSKTFSYLPGMTPLFSGIDQQTLMQGFKDKAMDTSSRYLLQAVSNFKVVAIYQE